MLADHSLGIPNDWGPGSVPAQSLRPDEGEGTPRKRVAPALLPPPLSSASLASVASLETDVPTNEALVQYLQERGLETEGWGKGQTKTTKKFWEELKEKESGLETWILEDGQTQLVRVTHVLRARVCSSESLARGVYLFNTWQQFGDGRKRTRNGLLSEKLTLSELPLEDHLMEVCTRAVCEEEMQRLTEVTTTVGPHTPAPPYDPTYRCPIKVSDAIFIEHTIEVETSKSYPGLLTMYHLYTVDIICLGLPPINFNTLEYEHPDDMGRRELKYVHAWVWLEWPQIKRYLFEGSEMKERKTKGSFKDEAALRAWLSQYNLDLASWGTGPKRSVRDLMKELEKEEAYLELWGRHDGAAMLMRVVHVLQVQVKIANSPHLVGKFLLQTWQQQLDGTVRTICRPMSCKLSSSELPFDEDRFRRAAKEVMERQLSTIVDAYFQLHPGVAPPDQSQFQATSFGIEEVEFIDHRFDLEESPSFKGMHTMYHLYTMEAQITGLPQTDFTTLDFEGKHGICVNGWTWSTWQQVMDQLHARIQSAERQVRGLSQVNDSQATRLEDCNKYLTQVAQQLKQQSAKDKDVRSSNIPQVVARVQKEIATLQALVHDAVLANSSSHSVAARLPPSMVSRMATETITTAGFLDQVNRQRFARASTVGNPTGSNGLGEIVIYESGSEAGAAFQTRLGSNGTSTGNGGLALATTGSRRSPKSAQQEAASNKPAKEVALSAQHRFWLLSAACIAILQLVLCIAMILHQASDADDGVGIVLAASVAVGCIGVAGALLFVAFRPHCASPPVPTKNKEVRIEEVHKSEPRSVQVATNDAKSLDPQRSKSPSHAGVQHLSI
mmetsp:Transcript_16226/g.37364  ORF Transcript_16226/g.37364 Transcript_16226/m.37364 type:complete len:839 (+) Transcript_16226:140-2656(+)